MTHDQLKRLRRGTVLEAVNGSGRLYIYCRIDNIGVTVIPQHRDGITYNQKWTTNMLDMFRIASEDKQLKNKFGDMPNFNQDQYMDYLEKKIDNAQKAVA